MISSRAVASRSATRDTLDAAADPDFPARIMLGDGQAVEVSPDLKLPKPPGTGKEDGARVVVTPDGRRYTAYDRNTSDGRRGAEVIVQVPPGTFKGKSAHRGKGRLKFTFGGSSHGK